MKYLILICLVAGSTLSHASDLDDLSVYIQCRKDLRSQVECEKTKGYKPWFKTALLKCLDENGHFDRDIGGDDFDCGNLE